MAVISGNLFILAFDHRGSFKKKMFGIDGEPTAEESALIADCKRVIWEGFKRALDEGAPRDAAGILVDEEAGADLLRQAKAAGVYFAMPMEKSGQPTFDFEYGDDFKAPIEEFDPSFVKVLVRWNPADSEADKKAQSERLKRLSDWLRANNRIFLFELLVPASDEQLAEVGGDTGRYDVELRPGLTVQTIREIQDAGVEPHIWKIEGLDKQEDCDRLATQIRSGGRDDVIAVVLGRGADDEKVEHWLRMGAPVDAYRGFAIGRSIFWDAVAGYKDGTMTEADAAGLISSKFRQFIDAYQSA